MTSADTLAQAALGALDEALKAEGLHVSPSELKDLVLRALDARAGTLTVTVTTPDGHAGPLAQSVATAIEKKTGKKVRVVEKADKRVLGGAIIEYGDERIDASVSRHLEDAETLLTSL